MGEEGDAVFGGDLSWNALNIALIAGGAVRGAVKRLFDHRKLGLCVGGISCLFPVKDDCISRLHGEPGVRCHNGDTITKVDDLFNAIHQERLRGIKPTHARAFGVHLDRREPHVGQTHIDAISRGARRFRDHVGAGLRGTEDFPVARIAERYVSRRQGSGVGREVGVGYRCAIGRDDHARFGPQVCRRDVQPFGGRLDQHLPCLRTCFAHFHIGVAG